MSFLLIFFILEILAYFIIKRFQPFLFWNKKNLDVEQFAKWREIFSGRKLSRSEIKSRGIKLPQCQKCLMAILNNRNISLGTPLEQSYADHKVIAVQVGNEIVFICKKHKMQLDKMMLGNRS